MMMIVRLFIRFSITIFMITSVVFPVFGNNDIPLFYNRQLQTTTSTTTIYRATYSADFSHYTDAFCYGDPPVLLVSCYGPAMVILKVSDPTIICSQTASPKIINGTTYQCENTCNGTVCDDIYGDFNYGRIEFICESDDYKQVNAQYTFLGGNDGSCDLSNSTSGLNTHIGRLGVSCPVGITREYRYDDTYVECGGEILDLASEFEDDIYACVTGANCEGLECNFTFASFDVTTTIDSFLDSCVEEVYHPSYKSTFHASWAQLYGTFSTIYSCTIETSSVIVTCGNNASIYYLNKTDPSTNCTSLNENEITCTADPSTIEDNFTSVFYDCIGPNIPTSQLRYQETNASCDGAFELTVSHAVSLGVYCDTDSEQFYYYRDLVFDCGEASNDFDVVYGEYGFNASRYICTESSTFAPGVTASQNIRNVTITTDQTWLNDPSGCVFPGTNFIPVNTAMPFTSSTNPTSSPLNAVTLSPSRNDTQLTKSPLNDTTPSPSMMGNRTATQPTSSPLNSPVSSSSMNKIIIGAVVGGVTLFALFALVGLYRKRNKNGTIKTNNESTSGIHISKPTSRDNFTDASNALHGLKLPNDVPPQRIRPVDPPEVRNDSSEHETKAKHETSSVSNPHVAAMADRPTSNYVVNVKDQCRSVVVARSHSPDRSIYASLQSENNVPLAVAVGVSTTLADPTPPNNPTANHHFAEAVLPQKLNNE